MIIKFSKSQLSKMQPGRLLYFILKAALAFIFKVGKTVVKGGVPILTGNATKYYLNKGIIELNKHFTASESSGITLRNDEIKNTIYVIRFIEKRGVLLKGTTKKVLLKTEDFSIFSNH